MKSALLLIILFQQALAQQSSRVLGIGIGTFIVLVAVIFSLLWCIACRSSSRPELCAIIGALIPIILAIAFALSPKVKDRPITTSQSDSNYVVHVVFTIIAVIGLTAVSLGLLLIRITTYKRAKSAARSAFRTKEDFEEEVNNFEPVSPRIIPHLPQLESNNSQNRSFHRE